MPARMMTPARRLSQKKICATPRKIACVVPSEMEVQLSVISSRKHRLIWDVCPSSPVPSPAFCQAA